MGANDKQISGDHYKGTPIECWDYIAANNLDWFQGNIVKYVTRFRKKGGRRDLEKAVHLLEKLIELEDAKEHGVQQANFESEVRHMLYFAMDESMKNQE